MIATSCGSRSCSVASHEAPRGCPAVPCVVPCSLLDAAADDGRGGRGGAGGGLMAAGRQCAISAIFGKEREARRAETRRRVATRGRFSSIAVDWLARPVCHLPDVPTQPHQTRRGREGGADLGRTDSQGPTSAFEREDEGDGAWDAVCAGDARDARLDLAGGEWAPRLSASSDRIFCLPFQGPPLRVPGSNLRLKSCALPSKGRCRTRSADALPLLLLALLLRPSHSSRPR